MGAKIFLLNSPLFRNKRNSGESYLPPMGLGYIATHLQKAGCEVSLIDAVSENCSIGDILKRICDGKPDFVGINVFSTNMAIVKEIVEKIDIKTVLVLGGRAVGYIYQEIFNWNACNDIVCIMGEGELIWPDIVRDNMLEEPILRYSNRCLYKVDKNSIYYPNDLERIHLDRSFFNNQYVLNKYGRKESYLITSRGCTYNCAFCSGARSQNQDDTVRLREYHSLSNELREIVEIDSEIKSIRVLDDLFLKNRDSIKTAVKLFSEFNSIHWRAMAHIEPIQKNLDLLGPLKESGCDELFIGVESGSKRIREFINKSGTCEEIRNVITAILSNGIDVKGYFIYGFPKEKFEDCENTFRLAKDLKDISKKTPGNFKTSVFQFRPYHGTQLYSYLLEHGKMINCYRHNNKIQKAIKREGFNFSAGNFSECKISLINYYINSTLELNHDDKNE